MDIWLLLVVFVIVLVLLGMISASEVAIASFGENKIEDMEERGDKLASSFKKIQNNPEAFFGTIQTTFTLLQLLLVLITYLIIDSLIDPLLFQSGTEQIFRLIIIILASVSIVSLFVLTTGTLIPKALGFKYADLIGKMSVDSLLILSVILRFPVRYITFVSNLILYPFKEKTNFSQTRLSEDEIRLILSEGVKSGAIDKTEHEIISNVFEFTDLRANEVMIPRTDMTALNVLEGHSEIIKEILKAGHSVIPAYEESPDNITGVFHTKDFIRAFLNNENIIPKNLLRPAYFVPETKLISEILKEMQKRGERLVIVTDEYGGTEGMITMEDILEEIVGKLGDNTKSEIPEYNKLSEEKYYVLGSMSVDDFNEVFNINLPESDEYNTVSGFVSYHTGKILNTGEVFEYEDLCFELIKKLRQKMVQFKVYSNTKNFHESAKRE